MLKISSQINIPDGEIEIRAIRAQGAGGQNVNKVATAIHLRFDIASSSLPDIYKQRLLKRHDQRITRDGVVIIKAQQFRSQEKNREDARSRLRELIRSVTIPRKKRIATKPAMSARQKRMDTKTKRARVKNLRDRKTLLRDL